MTTTEVATRLDVSLRQVQRLVASGALVPTRRVGRAWMIDAASVARLKKLDRHRGRPWQVATAWAGLWQLSGFGTPWLNEQASRRLDGRLHQIRAEELLWVCRQRAQTLRFRVSESFLAPLSTQLRLTGANAVNQVRDLLLPPNDSVDGYATTGECEAAVRKYYFVADPAGNVTLRVTDFPVVASWSGNMPEAVVGIDLLDSADPRDSRAGRQILERLLQ